MAVEIIRFTFGDPKEANFAVRQIVSMKLCDEYVVFAHGDWTVVEFIGYTPDEEARIIKALGPEDLQSSSTVTVRRRLHAA